VSTVSYSILHGFNAMQIEEYLGKLA
jgi:hypothetical protein